MGRRAKLGALGVGLALATVPVVGLEWQLRGAERANGLCVTPEGGRKYDLCGNPDRGQNAHGYRQGPVPAGPPAQGVQRVAVVGDSITFGAGVQPQQAFVQLTDQALADTEVLNFGIHGYDISQIAGVVRTRLRPLQPDLIVYAFFTNDFEPTELVQWGADQAPVFVGTGDPFRPDVPLAEAWIALAPRSAIVRRALGAQVSRAMALHPYGRADVSWFARHLDALAAACQEAGAELVIYGIGSHVLADPDPRACDARQPNGWLCSEQLRRLHTAHDLAHTAGLPFVSAIPWYQVPGVQDWALEATPDDAHHPNPEGHGRLAMGLVELVQDWRRGKLGPSAPPPLPEGLSAAAKGRAVGGSSTSGGRAVHEESGRRRRAGGRRKGGQDAH